MAQWFRRRRFSKFVNEFSLFRNYLPSEKCRALHLNKLVSKDTLCQVWLKLAQWFRRRRFSKCVNEVLLFCNYLPLEKGRPFNWTNLNPLHPKILYAMFGWYWPVSSGEKDENAKSLPTAGWTTDNRRSEKLTSFQHRWAKIHMSSIVHAHGVLSVVTFINTSAKIYLLLATFLTLNIV